MLVGGIGFPAAFVVCFLAIGLFIRRKWNLAAARQEEIKRLLVLASEEAARAELEASIEYSAAVSASYPSPVPVSQHPPPPAAFPAPSPQYYCAVCYVPTTNRCARCKAVRYCSFNCQIIHWRQGHKDQCSPPSNDPSVDSEQSSFLGRASKQDQHDPVSKIPDDEYDSATSMVYPQTLSRKGSITADQSSNGGGCASEGFENYPSSGVDVQLVNDDDGHFDYSSSESESLHELDPLDEDPQTTTDNLDAYIGSERSQEMKPPVFGSTITRLVDSVPRSTNVTDETKGVSSKLGHSSDDNLLSEPPTSSSGFWDGSLDFRKARKNVLKEGIKKSSSRAADVTSLDSRTLLHSSFKLSEEASAELPNHQHPGGMKGDHPTKESSLSGKEAINLSASSKSGLSTSDPHVMIDTETHRDLNLVKPQAVGPLSSSSSREHTLGGVPSVAEASLKDLSFSRSNKGVTEQTKSPHTLRSEAGGVSPTTRKSPSSSAAHGGPTSTAKAVITDNRSIVSPAPQVSSFPQVVSTSAKSSVLKVDLPKTSKLSRIYSFGFGSSPSGKSSQKGLFPYESFVKLYNWNMVELLPRGLINCGNSCYANAVLQCLAFTPPLTAYLLEAFHAKTCPKKDWCFTCEFERLILKAKDGGPPLSPVGILSQLQKIGSHLSNGREEDAHEFLRYLVDTMQSTCLAEAGVTGSKPLEDETTLIGLTFGGYLRSKIRCMRCRGKSERHERMMDLTVEIGGDIETLEEALRRFTGTEILDDQNKYQCGRCKSYEKAKKKLTILEAPNVLTIALKRFQYGKFGKLNKSIRFPEILNLAPYMRGSSDKSPIYRLYGVIVHLDIMNATFSGHYVCYVRNAQNKWFKIDDSNVKPTDLDSVLKKGAYMVFYSRLSPRAPRSIRSSMISQEVTSKPKHTDSDPFRGGGGGKNSLRPSPPHHIPAASFSPSDYVYSNLRGHDLDSSSNASSIFSNQSEEGSSTTTDSNQESLTSTDDLEYMSVEVQSASSNYWRNSSDSDTSSSSSSNSSSPLYMERVLLEKRASSRSGFTKAPSDHNKEGVVTFLQSGSPKHDSRSSSSSNRNSVNISSSSGSGDNSSSNCRETDSGRIVGPSCNTLLNTGVHLRKSTRKRAE